jgi:hypothetical protein
VHSTCAIASCSCRVSWYELQVSLFEGVIVMSDSIIGNYSFELCVAYLCQTENLRLWVKQRVANLTFFSFQYSMKCCQLNSVFNEMKLGA